MAAAYGARHHVQLNDLRLETRLGHLQPIFMHLQSDADRTGSETRLTLARIGRGKVEGLALHFALISGRPIFH